MAGAGGQREGLRRNRRTGRERGEGTGRRKEGLFDGLLLQTKSKLELRQTYDIVMCTFKQTQIQFSAMNSGAGDQEREREVIDESKEYFTFGLLSGSKKTAFLLTIYCHLQSTL